MEKLTFNANREQRNALDGLAYRIADIAYMKERWGKDEPEIQVSRDAVAGIFDDLDKMAVPFWLQNAVIAWAEDWRRYKSENLEIALNRKGYNVTFA